MAEAVVVVENMFCDAKVLLDDAMLLADKETAVSERRTDASGLGCPAVCPTRNMKLSSVKGRSSSLSGRILAMASLITP